MRARRNQVLTLRLSPAEMGLLAALRHCYFAASQADVVSIAMEDQCERIASGAPLQGVHADDAVAVCLAALQLHRAEDRLSWRGRPSTDSTPRERAVLQTALALPDPEVAVSSHPNVRA